MYRRKMYRKMKIKKMIHIPNEEKAEIERIK